MLRFACASAHQLDTLRSEGLPAGTVLYETRAEVKTDCRERHADAKRLVVVDTAELAVDETGALAVPAPPDRLLNLDPYMPPREVVAAGGLVVRKHQGTPVVLLIHRRGVWDLPKGKQDDGETVAETALREVREEVGIETLYMLGAADVTMHGYAEKGRYRVKTTHWYWMTTPQTAFVPEEREGIEQVAYVPWDEARTRLGYDTLRDLLDGLDPATILEA
ncbi:MAG: NUDIX hydrolase [Bacteroidota bacterium]